MLMNKAQGAAVCLGPSKETGVPMMVAANPGAVWSEGRGDSAISYFGVIPSPRTTESALCRHSVAYSG